MAQQQISIGSSADDGTGNPARTAFTKVNENFDELYISRLPTTTGSVSASSTALTLASATGFAQYQTIKVVGAGAAGADLITHIASISGVNVTLATAASTAVSGAAVVGELLNTPATVAAKLAAASTTQVNSFTDQATKLGTFLTVDETNYAFMATAPTGNFGHVIAQPTFNDFGTGQIDNLLLVWGSNYPQGGVYQSAAHPAYSESVENYYYTGTQYVVEHYFSYTSIDRGTSFRPWFQAIDTVSHKAETDFYQWRMRVKSRTGGSGGLPEFQFIIDTDNVTNTFYGPLDVDTSAISARNRAIAKVYGNQGTGNFCELVGSGALSTGQAHLYLSPYASPSATYVYMISAPSNTPRSVSDYRNTHATGTQELYLVSNRDSFIGFETAGGSAFAFGIDYSDSKALRLSTSNIPDENYDVIRFDITTRETKTAGVHYTYGGTKRYRQAKTTTYTLVATDDLIDCTSGTFTITLMAASGVSGRVFTIVNSGSGVVTLDGNASETINGATTRTLNQYDSVDILSDGTNWLII